MITLHDTFNNRLISSHRTLKNAVKAQRWHLARVQKANGKNSYLTYAFRENGKPVDGDEIVAIKCALDCGGAH